MAVLCCVRTFLGVPWHGYFSFVGVLCESSRVGLVSGLGIQTSVRWFGCMLVLTCRCVEVTEASRKEWCECFRNMRGNIGRAAVECRGRGTGGAFRRDIRVESRRRLAHITFAPKVQRTELQALATRSRGHLPENKGHAQ